MTSDENVWSLLKFTFNPQQFGHLGERIISRETEYKIERSGKILEKIINDGEKFEGRVPPDAGEIYKRFLAIAKAGNERIYEEYNSAKKVKKLAWVLGFKEKHLPAIFETEYFPHAIKVIETYWRNSMLFGLIDTLLKNWDKAEEANGRILKSFIGNRLTRYNSSRKSILNLKKNALYFTADTGALILGANLANTQGKLISVIPFLGLPDYMKTYPYFSSVAESYTNTALKIRNNRELILSIIEFLYFHETKELSKKCLSKIILYVANGNDLELIEEVKEASFKLIGDPANDSLWLPWYDASQKEINELKESQYKLNEWITEKFIELFFEKLAMDPARKIFWRRYLKSISKFKIYGTESKYYELKLDKRIEPYLSTRYGFFNSSSNSESALAMVVKDHVLVEFSNTGNAFYGYKLSNPYCPDITKKSLRINELKVTKNNDARFVHIGNWQYKIADWLFQRLGVQG